MNERPAVTVECEECGRSVSERSAESVGCPFCREAGEE